MNKIKLGDVLTIAGFIFLAGMQIATSQDTRRRVESVEVEMRDMRACVGKLSNLVSRLDAIVEILEKN